MATKKRATPTQSARAQKQALEQRFRDIFSGALGMAWDTEGMCVGAEELSRIVPAVKEIFGLEEQKAFLVSPANLHHYDSPESLAEVFWRHGLRA